MSKPTADPNRDLGRELSRLVVLLAVVTALFVVTLALVPLKASRTDWRAAQRSYNLQADAVSMQPVETGIKQIWRPEVRLTDRCTSCHLGMGPAPGVEGGNTLAAPHPDVYHDVGRMGCTICHRGQGRATSTEAAHGDVEHWEDPMIEAEYLDASCGPCHAESIRVPTLENSQAGAELFAAKGCDRCHQIGPDDAEAPAGFFRIGLTSFERSWQPLHAGPKLVEQGYPMGTSVAQLTASELELVNDYLDSLVGAPRLIRGLQVGHDLGCQGCHRLWGAGSDQGPAINDAASKPATQRDFRKVPGPHTSVAWHREHLRNAVTVSPGSKMPNFNLQTEDEEALLTLIMALRQYDLSLDELPPETVLARVATTRAPEEDGNALFRRFCVGCHADGVDDRIVPPNKAVPHITYPSVLAVASRDYLEYSIAQGREGREMPGWASPEIGMLPEEIAAIAGYLAGGLPDPPSFEAVREALTTADPETGRQLFNADCARCHGRDAAGTLLAPALAQPEFLAIASDRALYETVTRGRPEVGMPRMTDYSAQFLANMIAWLRSESPDSASAGAIRLRAQRLLGVGEIDGYRSEGSAASGESVYRSRCAICHEGVRTPDSGPRLLRSELLAQVSDGFLVAAALLEGGYCRLQESDAPLPTRGDLDDIVTFLRAAAPAKIPRPARASLTGDADSGRTLFATHCSGCHGVEGGGDKAPALNNQALLASATDGFLMATIIRGRAGTAMPSWGPGGAAQPPLKPREILDLVAFVRSWQKPIAPSGNGATSASAETG